MPVDHNYFCLRIISPDLAPQPSHGSFRQSPLSLPDCQSRRVRVWDDRHRNPCGRHVPSLQVSSVRLLPTDLGVCPCIFVRVGPRPSEAAVRQARNNLEAGRSASGHNRFPFNNFKFFELSFQSSLHLSLTVLVCYRSPTVIFSLG